jgi:hypothetical protein
MNGMKSLRNQTRRIVPALAFAALAFVAMTASSLAAQGQTAPAAPRVTTLAAETANNTSADNSWRGGMNSVPKGGNVSPLPLSSLLPPGTQTRFIAHVVPFFTSSCTGNPKNCHISVGYDQNDSAVVARQMADMRRRGFSVVLLDWYGQENTHADGTAQKIMQESERLKRSGIDFPFVLTPDKGVASKCNTDPGCNTSMVIEALNYAAKTYFRSPAYLRVNGRPVVPFFWFDSNHPVNWDQVVSQIPGNPILVFINSGGFHHPDSGGAFSWEGFKGTTDEGLDYLDNFYKAAQQEGQGKVVIGDAYPGFDDRLASWGKGKIADRRCGQTWLDSVNESLQYQKLTGNALPFLQVVTWNDYEEGTAVEPGIDNCVAAIPASIQGNKLTWSVAFGKDPLNISGSEATIAFYRIYASPDGQTLQEVSRVPTNPQRSGKYSLDLAPLHLQSGQKLYVEVVGKSMILNHLSDAVAVP